MANRTLTLHVPKPGLVVVVIRDGLRYDGPELAHVVFTSDGARDLGRALERAANGEVPESPPPLLDFSPDPLELGELVNDGSDEG